MCICEHLGKCVFACACTTNECLCVGACGFAFVREGEYVYACVHCILHYNIA